MPVILEYLYREYCRARLAEMRKQLLIRAPGQDSSETNRDASHRHHADGGAQGLDGSPGDAPTGPIERSP